MSFRFSISSLLLLNILLTASYANGDWLSSGVTIYQPTSETNMSYTSGNIGIGYDNSPYKLGIKYNKEVLQPTHGTDFGMYLGNSHNNGRWSGLVLAPSFNGVSYAGFIAGESTGSQTNHGKIHIGSHDGNTSYLPRLTINTLGGQVGVGTTAPQASVDVDGVIRSTSTINTPSTGVGLEMFYSTGNQHGRIYAYDRDIAEYKKMVIGSGYQLSLLSNGNVGIGLTNPLSTLHVNATDDNSTISLTNTYTGNTTTDGSHISVSKFTGGFTVMNKETSGSNPFLSLGTNNEHRLFIKQNGNIGIGNIEPAYKLDVSGAINAQQVLINGTPLTNYVGPWDNSGSNILFTSGNIGVGTTNPAHQVVSQVSTGDKYAYQALSPNGTNAGGIWVGSGGGSDLYLKSAGGNPGTYLTGGGNNYFAGNVGIGVVVPNYDLEVAGTISAEQILLNGVPIEPPSPVWNESTDNLSYNTGKVGIGTSDPEVKLHVQGKVKVSESVEVIEDINVHGYTKLGLTSDYPPADHCNEFAHYGRMKVDPYTPSLFICTKYGWMRR
ncbi:MAG: hypothetical protein KC646_07280 [Candidatus Cloacimonetes bacterium]|nr:hypothetical protein [Candidatus Cloacimonadota bacterium]